ncbi:hypothetical protein C8J56DRAFT_274645 [Mycena floridula]|nr:hypothetical protein C8J56DRAFT_274645 [Mycena floridula]
MSCKTSQDHRGGISARAGQISAAETAMKSLDEKILLLQQERERCLRLVSEYNAVIAPVRQIPTEILSSIFIEVLQAEIDSVCWSEDRRSSNQTSFHQSVAWTLSHICHCWRTLITLGFPRLWSHVVWYDRDEPSWEAKPLNQLAGDRRLMLRTFLERSGQHYLYVNIHCECDQL